MIIRKYKIPAELTVARLRDYVARFFRTAKFGKRFINIYIVVKGASTIHLGKRVVIDSLNKKEVYSYLDMISDDLVNSKYVPKANDILFIYYIESDKEFYDKYIEKISSFNKLEKLLK